jgi:hypothetical protein
VQVIVTKGVLPDRRAEKSKSTNAFSETLHSRPNLPDDIPQVR